MTGGTTAIVVAGGSGERLGLPGGKQLAVVAGRPVVSWSLLALERSGRIDDIVLVCPRDREEEYRSVAVAPLVLRIPVAFAPSGSTRQESVASGLAATPGDAALIVVHDGARPLVTSALVGGAIDALEGTALAAGVVVGQPAMDTLKVVDGDRVLSTPDRSRFWTVQTPQVFRAADLREAYALAEREGFFGTDDASLVERAGGTVLVVEGSRDNMKVTVVEDLAIIEAALAFREHGEES